MQRPSKLLGHAGADPEVMAVVNRTEDENVDVHVPEAESDSEYENVPKKAKSANMEKPAPPQQDPTAMDVDELVAEGAAQSEQPQQPEDTPADPPAALTDDDWLRSRTSRLLGLAGDDEEEDESAPPPTTSATTLPQQDKVEEDFEGFKDDANPSEQTLPVVTEDVELEDAPPMNDVEAKVRQSQRLYLRNLSYNITEDDLRSAFDGFGNLDEVSHTIFSSSHPQFHDEHLIGTSDAIAHDVKRIEYFSRCFSSLKETNNPLFDTKRLPVKDCWLTINS